MKKVLTKEERIENNRAIAESYYHAYDKKAVKDGAVYDVPIQWNLMAGGLWTLRLSRP